jgi:ribosomal protein S12 methylthiotransferase
MQVQADISRRRLAARIGTVQRVLIDQAAPGGGIGRTAGEAPEIDGVVRVAADRTLQPGQFYDARIVDSDEHDLSAVLVRSGSELESIGSDSRQGGVR